jgi:hypothetical protein
MARGVMPPSPLGGYQSGGIDAGGDWSFEFPKIGASVGQSLLTEYLKQHYGIH